MADIVAFIISQDQALQWVETAGRSPVTLVYLPAALLAAAGLIELWRTVRRKGSPSLAAMFAMGVGGLLAVIGSHAPLVVAAAAVAVGSLVLLAMRRPDGRGRLAMFRLGAIACAGLVVAGHFGDRLEPRARQLLAMASGKKTWTTEAVAAVERDAAPVEVVSIDAAAKKPARAMTIAPLPAAFPADGKIDFVRDVQPILARSCFECHDTTRRGSLRLDNKHMAFEGGNSGKAIVPDRSAESILIKRVRGEGQEKRMPFKRPPLPEYQIAILRAWIDQGADWPDHASNHEGEEERHWAYVKPAQPKLPVAKNEQWPRNGIDHFVLARLEKEGLSPSPEADRATLIRRLSLDLIGLPPTVAEVDAFVADTSIDAYDKLVNRLLASPHYGERWGRHWLDIARYADTNGYEKDNQRSIWPYRDWVIDAINRDVTFDQFTIAQIAGDMLPNASADDRIATGFHRNTMFNEEGGIDVEEFRYKAVVDRVQTTATAWLGLTMQCAQCHNHKYDDLSQREYFQFYAMLNNADEPTFNVPRADVSAKRKEIEAKIASAEKELESQFPTHEEVIDWEVLTPSKFTAKEAGVVLTKQSDGSILASGAQPATDRYTIEAPADLSGVVAVRLEALTDPSLPKNGPGRGTVVGNGNFVLTEFKVAIAEEGKKGKPKFIPIAAATADFAQENFSAAAAIDGIQTTGWAIASLGGNTNVNRTITFRFAKEPVAEPAKLVFTLDQQYANHPLGKFRLSVGRAKPDPSSTKPEAERRAAYLAAKMAEWEAGVAAKAAKWTQLDPTTFARRHGATITKLDDRSLLFTGDNLYRDEYEMGFATDVAGITAIRLEVLPHAEQPRGGPGRSRDGGFLVSGLNITAGDAPVEVARATADISPDTVARTIDGKKDTHWTVPTGDAKPHAAVFQLKSPLTLAAGAQLKLALLQNYHQSENIGRLRVSVTTDPRAAIDAAGVPEDVEAIVLTPVAQRTAEQLARLKQHFLSITPLLAERHQAIATLRKSMPEYPTTLVMEERATPRVTRIMHRGEFLQPKDEVQPGVPAVLHALPKAGPRDRMALARWLVAPDNPLVGRVVMNRVWAQYFGRGIVNTVEDFGIMGEKPSHPELLDWLATEFVRQNWSMKSMHRIIVTSSTYRQSSRVTPELLTKDPANVLMARGPRVRVEAETVRDIALAASGLLNEKIGGPSVYPPQPPGITELSYGPLAWPTSEGADRYRRGIYTFAKRTSMYPGLIIFDGPTSEMTCARRIRSNTPLQALTTLNDAVFVEAAQALGRRVVEEAETDDVEARIREVFRLCVAREPAVSEVERIKAYYETQIERFREKKADPALVALRDPKDVPAGMDLPEVAAWTMVARTMLNLDETVTKE